jgi:hypothetical protein
MPLWRLQCQWAADNTTPRDALVITPHFNDTLVGSDPQGLCDDLADGLAAFSTETRQVIVTAYDAQGTPPVFPVASAIRNTGVAPISTIPREIAICLSFYSERNLPRNRGRLYIPACIIGQSLDERVPALGQRAKVAELVPLFTGLGGTDVDWVVYSRRDNQPRSVSNWWIDDEWDTVRSRGFRPSERTEGTVGE